MDDFYLLIMSYVLILAFYSDSLLKQKGAKIAIWILTTFALALYTLSQSLAYEWLSMFSAVILALLVFCHSTIVFGKMTHKE